MASPVPGCAIHGAVPLRDDEVDSSPIPTTLPTFPGYHAVSAIGRGGFGDVYRAEPDGGGPAVAVKVARADRPDARAALAQELAVMAAVGPPHVPAVHAEGTLPDGRPYVVMEYIAAPTLAARLLPGAAPIGIAETCAIAIAILRALEAVHARGYVHRDLKPDNVFGDAAGRATLVDFGLVVREGGAKGTGDDDSSSEGAAAGTAEYMAPEQCEGQIDIDARADIYAVGVMIFELVAGRPPFWGARTVVYEAHRSRRPPRLSALAEGRVVPAALEEVVARCLAKDRRERYPDVAALRAAIEEAARASASANTDPAAPAEAPGAADRDRGGRARGDRITVGLLFFEADTDVSEVQARIVALGGQLAHSGGGRFVALFGQERGDNPARQALRAAEELLRDRLCARFRLDLAPVSAQARPNGTKRFVSPLFARGDRYPAPTDAPGITLSSAAAAVLPDVASAPVVRPPEPAPLDHDTTLTAEVPAWPLVGRDALVDAIIASAQAAIFGQTPTAVSVVGDAGHGKSHVHRVCSKRLAELHIADVLELRAREPALGDVDHTLAELLRRALGLPAVPPPDNGADLLRERLGPGSADRAPVVAQALGWTASIPPDSSMGTALRTLSAAPGALRAALTVAAGDALRRRAEARPLFVVLDDAHYASDVLVAALEYAALAEHRAPIWICAFGRPSFAEEHPAWGERAGRREAHQVGPLAPEDAAALCRRLLLPVESVPDHAAKRLVARSRAVPLLLVELVRGLRREGLVRRRPKGDAYYLATDELDRVPDLPLVEWLARRELDALPPALGAHARLLALLGEDVSPPDVAGVLARLEQQGGGAEFPLDAKVANRRLLEAGLLAADKQGAIAFRHALVREEIAKNVPEAMRRRIHLAAALHYAAAEPGGEEDRRLAQLGFHAARAGLAAEAEIAYLALAERMRAQHAYLPAERFYSRAIEQSQEGDDARRLGAYRGRGLMRYRIGRYDDALADFAAARALAHGLGDVAAEIDILLDEATALDWMHEYKSSEERVEAARALSPGAPSPLLSARLLLGVGRSAHRFSREKEAVPLLESAAAKAAALGDAGYETLVIALMLLGFIHQQLDRLEDAQRALDRCIELCEEHADLLHLAGAINNRALLRAFLREREGMIEDMERGLALARALGQDSLELIARYNLGEYLHLMDELDAAEPHVRRAIEIERRLRGDAGRPVVELLDARCRYYRGDEAAARAIVDRIRARQEEARARGQTDALMVPSEDVLCTAVDLATRGADAEAWEALAARSADYSVGQEHVEVLELRGVAALRRGQAGEAIAALERALAAAARIPNVMAARLLRRMAEARQLAGC